MESICDGPGNKWGPLRYHWCSRCNRELPHTAFRLRPDGQRNKTCGRCRRRANECDNERKKLERRTDTTTAMLKNLPRAQGWMRRCEVCNELVAYTTHGVTGQLVALDVRFRTKHRHQPPPNDPAANRARVAAGACCKGYHSSQTRAKIR